jgi:hypothetical protein
MLSMLVMKQGPRPRGSGHRHSMRAVVPFFVSTPSMGRTMGTVLAVSLAVATLAAVLSGMVVAAVGLEQRLSSELSGARLATPPPSPP